MSSPNTPLRIASLSVSGVYRLVTILSLLRSATAVSVNRIIDDEDGDSATGTKPVYTPADGWAQGATCRACAVDASLIDPSQVYDGTWHATTGGTAERTITVSFTGVSVNVFFVIARPTPSTVATTNLTFTLDPDQGADAEVTTLEQFPSLVDGQPAYSSRMFGVTGLANRAHTLVIRSAGPTNTLYAFDYVQYVAATDDISTGTFPTSSARTSLDIPEATSVSAPTRPVAGPSTTGNGSLSSSTFPPTSTMTSTINRAPSSTGATPSGNPHSTPSHGDNIGAVVGGVLGGLALTFLCTLAFLLLRRRRRRGRPRAWTAEDTDEGADGGPDRLTILPVLFADSRSVLRTSSQGSADGMEPEMTSVYVQSPPAAYAMFARHSHPQGHHAYPTGSQDPFGTTPDAHVSRISLPPSYAYHQPTPSPELPQAPHSPSAMSHHTALPPYTSAPPSLAHAGARRHVELTRLIRVLEGQLSAHDTRRVPHPPSPPPQGPHPPTGTPDPKTRAEKPGWGARARARADARRRAEAEEHRSRRARLAALLAELTEARALLAEEEAPVPSSSDRELT